MVIHSPVDAKDTSSSHDLVDLLNEHSISVDEKDVKREWKICMVSVCAWKYF